MNHCSAHARYQCFGAFHLQIWFDPWLHLFSKTRFHLLGWTTSTKIDLHFLYVLLLVLSPVLSIWETMEMWMKKEWRKKKQTFFFQSQLACWWCSISIEIRMLYKWFALNTTSETICVELCHLSLINYRFNPLVADRLHSALSENNGRIVVGQIFITILRLQLSRLVW